MTGQGEAPQRLVIATRASALALWQAEHVRDRLIALYPGCQVELLVLSTRGDEILDRSLSKIGGKGLFTKELEQALYDGRADLAVHSLKDVPMDLPAPFSLAAVLARADARDALVSSQVRHLGELPAGAVVGTSSLRRESQIRAVHPQLTVRPLRGNVNTRLAKLDRGEYDAIVLAAAGLQRLGFDERIARLMPVDEMLPAVGQGMLGIEVLDGRPDLTAWLAPLACPRATACALAERAVSRALGGSCQVPLAAHARVDGDQLHLDALVASPDGQTVIRAASAGAVSDADALGRAAAAQLMAQGADGLLARLLSTDGPGAVET